MTAGNQLLASRPAWKALEAHHQKVRGLHLRKLFADDPQRGERMTAEAVGIFLLDSGEKTLVIQDTFEQKWSA